jgi:hypothetical protein
LLTVSEDSVMAAWPHDFGQNVMVMGLCGRRASYLMADRK